jgi:hypothetical protein
LPSKNARRAREGTVLERKLGKAAEVDSFSITAAPCILQTEGGVMQEATVKPMQSGRFDEKTGAESAWKVVIVEEDEGGRIQREVRVHRENLSYEQAMSEAQDLNRQLSAKRDA